MPLFGIDRPRRRRWYDRGAGSLRDLPDRFRRTLPERPRRHRDEDALGLLARIEGKAAIQPLNAVSQWLHGGKAGAVAEADLAHTGTGAVTQILSAIFWATPYAWWLSRRQHRSTAEVMAGAAAVASVAALVDYGLMPRRLRPGWEHAVPPRSVAGGFAALALGLAAGGLITEALRR
jgi:hypothetical protein